MAVASPALRELELAREGLEWVNPPVVVAHPFDDGRAIVLHRDVATTCESLGGAAGDGWAAATERMLPLADALAESVLTPLPPGSPALRLAAGLRGELAEWTRRLLGFVEALGLDLFDGDRRASAWLSGSAQRSGLPPDATISGAFGFLLQLVGHEHGWPLPRGGMGRLVDALVARATRSGATIRCGAPVAAIETSRGRVAGVRLADGERTAADAVLTTVTAPMLARLLPSDALPGTLHRRLRRWRMGTAPFKLDYPLSAPLSWTASEARESAVVHVGGELEELAAAAQAATRGEMPESPALVVGQQSLYDPTRAPAGAHTLYVCTHVPARYRQTDEQVADLIELQLERFAPGFGGLVLERAIRSPAQTEHDNPSLVGGDLGGGSYELDQQLVFRPAPSLCRYRAPLRGLYVAGASTHPGGAIHGVSGPRSRARSAARPAPCASAHDVPGRYEPWPTTRSTWTPRPRPSSTSSPTRAPTRAGSSARARSAAPTQDGRRPAPPSTMPSESARCASRTTRKSSSPCLRGC